MITITNDALNKIKMVLSSNVNKVPRIVLKAGGCAGHMLILTLDQQQANDLLVESNGIVFAIASNAEKYVDSITIYLKDNLGTNIAVKQNNRPTCRCGKSFRINI